MVMPRSLPSSLLHIIPSQNPRCCPIKCSTAPTTSTPSSSGELEHMFMDATTRTSVDAPCMVSRSAQLQLLLRTAALRFSLCHRGTTGFLLPAFSLCSPFTHHGNDGAFPRFHRNLNRSYATSSSNNSNGNFSLSDLARAFQQMGTAETEGIENKKIRSNNRNSDQTATMQASSCTNRHNQLEGRDLGNECIPNTQAFVVPPGSLPSSTQQSTQKTPESPGAPHAPTQEPHSSGSFKSATQPWFSSSPPSYSFEKQLMTVTTPGLNAAAATTAAVAPAGPFVTFSMSYSAHLASLTEVQLCAEVESQLGRQHLGNMLQCVYEVIIHRLPALATDKSTEATIMFGRGSVPPRRRTTADEQSTSSNATEAARTTSRESADQEKYDNRENNDFIMAQSICPSSTFQEPPYRCGKASMDSPPQQRAFPHQALMRSNTSPAIQQNHRLLTAVLRMTVLVDVYAIEPEFNSWANASSSPTANHDCNNSNSEMRRSFRALGCYQEGSLSVCHPFSYLLAQGMLRWLSGAVATMDAATSLQVLHLLAQQNLAWSDDVLRTLVDTIQVHIDQVAPAARPFQLEHYSLLLDTMARFQAQQVNVSRLQSLTTPNSITGATFPRDVHVEPTFSPVPAKEEIEERKNEGGVRSVYHGAIGRRRALENNHPVANSHFFSSVSEALTRELEAPKKSEKTTTTTSSISALAPSSDALLHVSNASVLFLTRALSRLHWWSDTLMAALTAPLTKYLQLHSESYSGVVMLVGRRENNVGDVALLFVLQDSLLSLLRRRRHFNCVDGSRRGVADSLPKNRDKTADPMEGFSGKLFNRLEEVSGEALCFTEEDGEESEELIFFSERAHDAAVLEDVNRKRSGSNESAHGHPQQREDRRPARPTDGSLSLIDLRSFPAFLDSLTRFHLRTLQKTSPQPVTLALPDAAAEPAYNMHHSRSSSSARDGLRSGGAVMITHDVLQLQMRELFALLQEDLQRSIPSLEAFAGTTAAPLLAHLLTALITATEELELEARASNRSYGRSSDDNNQAASPPSWPLPLLSPLLVELTYVWTLHVAQLRPPPLPPRDGRASTSSADVALFYKIAASTRWRRAVRMHRLLVHAGLLQRTRSSFPNSQPSSGGYSNNVNNKSSISSRVKTGGSGEQIEYACEPGRYFMPEEVIAVAPRVGEAIKKAKEALQESRQRKLNQLLVSLKSDEAGRTENDERNHIDSASGRRTSTHNSENSQQHQKSSHPTRKPRFASASMRGSSTPAHSTDRVKDERRRAAAAVLRQPVRTSDVFAGYSRSLSRLL